MPEHVKFGLECEVDGGDIYHEELILMQLAKLHVHLFTN
jgi:hypothetical protein